MSTIIKLVVTVVLLNAVGRVGWAAWNYYQFRDAAEEAVVFGGQEQPSEIHNRILRKAAELDLPVKANDVNVERQGFRTEAHAQYTQAVELFPRYRYPFKFSFAVDAVSLTGLK